MHSHRSTGGMGWGSADLGCGGGGSATSHCRLCWLCSLRLSYSWISKLFGVGSSHDPRSGSCTRGKLCKAPRGLDLEIACCQFCPLLMAKASPVWPSPKSRVGEVNTSMMRQALAKVWIQQGVKSLNLHQMCVIRGWFLAFTFNLNTEIYPLPSFISFSGSFI